MFKLPMTIVLTLLICAINTALAEEPPPPALDQNQAREQNQLQQQQQVRGRDLMSPEERAQHREQMRTMKTEEERNAYREQQHKKMQERARQKGLALPDKPRARQGFGGGMGGPHRGGGAR